MCLWGVDVTDNGNYLSATNRNGLYRYAGGSGSTTYFRLDRSGADCGTNRDYLYLYSTIDSDSIWTISETGPEFNGLVYGKCSVQTQTPDRCGTGVNAVGVWTIDQNEQPRAKVYVDRCPTGPNDASSCQSITVSAQGSNQNGCDYGDFLQNGDNQYAKTEGTSEWVWWFNLPTFQWICTRTLNNGQDPSVNLGVQQTLPATPVGTCLDNLYFIPGDTSNAGRKLSKINGYEGPFAGAHPTDSDDSAASLNTKTYTFTCNNPGAGTTTAQPTQATPFPTLPLVPVPPPTFATTANPTVPTADPVSPTVPTVDSGNGNGNVPTTSTQVPTTDESGKGDNGDGDDHITSSPLFWILLIILILLVCCCCIGIVLFVRSRKRGNAYFGNTADNGL